MPNLAPPPATLHDAIAGFSPLIFDLPARRAALERFATTPAGHERPGRYWRIDLDAVAPDPATILPDAGTVAIENPTARILACDLLEAARTHPALLRRALGATGAGAGKYGALTAAFAHLGAFVHIPAGVDAAGPVRIDYALPEGRAAFPYTVVLAEAGARAEIVIRFTGNAPFVATVEELVAEQDSNVTVAVAQALDAGSSFFATRSALPQRNAAIAWACADLGAALAVSQTGVSFTAPGARAGIANLFFPHGKQHVDAVAAIDHAVGQCSSDTLVKSAAVDDGQARFLGSIRIAADAQGSNAGLRDDALLLSPRAHIDSVPALEIAANDVKAYHGATVGAIDADHIFYMQSRGFDRRDAERAIALGFFEPAIGRFPTEALRDELRAAVAAKLA